MLRVEILQLQGDEEVGKDQADPNEHERENLPFEGFFFEYSEHHACALGKRYLIDFILKLASQNYL